MKYTDISDQPRIEGEAKQSLINDQQRSGHPGNTSSLSDPPTLMFADSRYVQSEQL